MSLVLPVWRRYHLARTDWPLDEQIYVLQALLDGFVAAVAPAHPLRSTTIDEPAKVMAAAVTTLLGPEEASPADVRAVADEALQLLRAQRESVLASLVQRRRRPGRCAHRGRQHLPGRCRTRMQRNRPQAPSWERFRIA
ncbi:hypothetical protein DDE74_30515 [Streptomyces lydicus]|uniref:Uncharacterized protein n=1 Tax=Streptomyces lydicus TaxID=47763 RepID=A0A3Q9KDJ1_9ACTN|nr:hypothetical protein [Streptomyces lydicus]AZS74700.1 hypothetical protein DDE74_30515 [Streptomyces lydicus]